MRSIVFNFRKTVSVLVALIIMFISVCSYSSVTAETNGITYWRHDCTSSDLSSYTSYSLSFAEAAASPATVFDTNNMVRCYDTAVVRIEEIHGTGFIVGNHVIATAAHCVYNNSGFLVNNISIVDSDNNVIDTIQPKYIHIPEMYGRVRNINYDYALIYVEENLSEYGMFYLGNPLDSYISNQSSVVVAGFPESYPYGYTQDWGMRFKSAGTISSEHTTGTRLYYNSDTVYGNSGSPVFVTEGVTYNGTLEQYNTVIAIHTRGDDGENPVYNNSGVRVNSDMLYFYYSNPNKTA